MSNFLDEPRHPVECDIEEEVDQYGVYKEHLQSLRHSIQAVKIAYFNIDIEPEFENLEVSTAVARRHGPQPRGGPFRKHGKHYR